MNILITQDTFAPSLKGMEFVSTNEVIEIETDNGHAIVAAGKGLYIDDKDAKGRPAHLLASKDRLTDAEALRKEAAAAAKAAAKKPD